jgi:lysyl-tRNA synthetase class 1
LHSFYELFTERSGKKISKSAGNVFTPARWMKYASPVSLRLLFLKRLGTSRVVDPDAIPAYMDEVDELEKIYFGKVKVANPKELEHQKRLYQYIYFLKPPQKVGISVQYNMLANLLRLARDEKVARDILHRTGHIPELSHEEAKELEERFGYVRNWINDTVPEEKIVYSLSDAQKKSIKKLIYELESKKWHEEELYARLYAIPKEDGLEMGKFFEAAYVLLLNSLRGPRLAQFIVAMGPEKIAHRLKSRLEEF